MNNQMKQEKEDLIFPVDLEMETKSLSSQSSFCNISSEMEFSSSESTHNQSREVSEDEFMYSTDDQIATEEDAPSQFALSTSPNTISPGGVPIGGHAQMIVPTHQMPMVKLRQERKQQLQQQQKLKELKPGLQPRERRESLNEKYELPLKDLIVLSASEKPEDDSLEWRSPLTFIQRNIWEPLSPYSSIFFTSMAIAFATGFCVDYFYQLSNQKPQLAEYPTSPVIESNQGTMSASHDHWQQEEGFLWNGFVSQVNLGKK